MARLAQRVRAAGSQRGPATHGGRTHQLRLWKGLIGMTYSIHNRTAFERVERELTDAATNLRKAADEIDAFRAILHIEVAEATPEDAQRVLDSAGCYLTTNIADRVVGTIWHATARASRCAASAMVAASHLDPTKG
jgi:hypothetical protein